jgi:hypothetical protein
VPRKIRKKNRGTFENADEDHALMSEVSTDIRSHRSNTIGNLLARDEYLQLRHGQHITACK